MAVLAMFPLGAVLLPGSVIPLHVFEPRYRAMVRHCLDHDREFGVVLIERGSEVGGGDVRATVATAAKIAEAQELPDGRYVLIAEGTRRLKVTAWLDDDPYPLAEVVDWPDEPPDAAFDDRLAPVVSTLRRLLALASELGIDSPAATTEVVGEAVMATYHVAALAPVGPADRYKLLAADGPERRVVLLMQMLGDAEQLIRLQLAEGWRDDPPTIG